MRRVSLPHLIHLDFFLPKYLRRVANYENPKVKGGETVKRDAQIESVARERTD